MAEQRFISFDAIWRNSTIVAQKLRDDGASSTHPFSAIVAIIRGGILPAGMLSYQLGVSRILPLSAKNYDEDHCRLPAPRVEACDSFNLRRTSRVLVVDELIDSGATMCAVVEAISNRFSCAIACAALYRAHDAQPPPVPTFVAEELEKNHPWLTFPWEE